MFKKIFKLVKKVIMAALIIYAYNVIAAPLDTIIPINIFTVLFVTFLGLPSMFALAIFSLLLF